MNRSLSIDSLNQDIRFAVRRILCSPAFAFIAIFTLALGIGANAAIFSLVDAIILRPLPYPNPQQLVGLGQRRNQVGEGYVQTCVSAHNMADIARKTKIFQWSGFNITESSRPESITGIKASHRSAADVARGPARCADRSSGGAGPESRHGGLRLWHHVDRPAHFRRSRTAAHAGRACGLLRSGLASYACRTDPGVENRVITFLGVIDQITSAVAYSAPACFNMGDSYVIVSVSFILSATALHAVWLPAARLQG
jgi:hypothetical protein